MPSSAQSAQSCRCTASWHGAKPDICGHCDSTLGSRCREQQVDRYAKHGNACDVDFHTCIVYVLVNRVLARQFWGSSFPRHSGPTLSRSPRSGRLLATLFPTPRRFHSKNRPNVLPSLTPDLGVNSLVPIRPISGVFARNGPNVAQCDQIWGCF